MREKLEAVLNKIRPGLGSADVALRGISEGVVKVKIWEAPSCASGVPKDLVLEILEEELKKEVPEVKEVIAV
jgi:Fe-S cluster biogenesis protein NfuA